MEALWLSLQQSSFAAGVRSSEFIYPAANVLHVVGVIGFFGLVAAMDFQILAGSGSNALVARLRPYAIAALAVVALAGFTLFAADAVAVAANPVFQLKLLAILLAVLNFAIHLSARDRPGVLRATAAVSLVAWLVVAGLGRYIAYA
jgi:hypothetical protein